MDRRCSDRRIQVDVPAELVAEGGVRSYGLARDISVGGVRVETDMPVSFGSAMVVRMQLPGSTRDLVLPAIVRWTRLGVVGLQFGLLGARETHLIMRARCPVRC